MMRRGIRKLWLPKQVQRSPSCKHCQLYKALSGQSLQVSPVFKSCFSTHAANRSLLGGNFTRAEQTAPCVFIAAGEPSGDALGAAVMRELQIKYGSEIKFKGVGGVAMQAAGLETLFPMDDLTVAGFAEVFVRLPRLVLRYMQTLRAVRRLKPCMVIGVDYKGFNLRLLRALAADRDRRGTSGSASTPDSASAVHHGARSYDAADSDDWSAVHGGPALVQLVGPSAWAFADAQRRAARLAGWLDHLLVLLPFESRRKVQSMVLAFAWVRVRRRPTRPEVQGTQHSAGYANGLRSPSRRKPVTFGAKRAVEAMSKEALFSQAGVRCTYIGHPCFDAPPFGAPPAASTEAAAEEEAAAAARAWAKGATAKARPGVMKSMASEVSVAESRAAEAGAMEAEASAAEEEARGVLAVDFRRRHNIRVDARVVCLLPGSRAQEVHSMLPTMLEAARLMHSRLLADAAALSHAESTALVELVVPVATSALEPCVRAMVNSAQACPRVLVVEGAEKRGAYAASALALAACGTVNVELAAARVPQIALYRTSRLSSWLIRSVLRPTLRHATLPNILLNRTVIPELLFERCNAVETANAAIKLLTSPEEAAAQRRELYPLKSMLQAEDDAGVHVSSASVAAHTLIPYLPRRR